MRLVQNTNPEEEKSKHSTQSTVDPRNPSPDPNLGIAIITTCRESASPLQFCEAIEYPLLIDSIFALIL